MAIATDTCVTAATLQRRRQQQRQSSSRSYARACHTGRRGTPWYRLLVTAVAAAVGPLQAAAVTWGAVKLDNKTFYKVVNTPGVTVLVKLDVAWPSSWHHDVWTELCKRAAPVKDFVVADIPVSPMEDLEQEHLAERYGIVYNEYPAFILFKGNTSEPIRFTGIPDPQKSRPPHWDERKDGPWVAPTNTKRNAENLVLWLRENGVNMPFVGVIADMDDAAELFMRGSQREAMNTARWLAGRRYKNIAKAQMYVDIMEMVAKKGRSYIREDTDRVQSLLQGNVEKRSKLELTSRLAILKAFRDFAKAAVTSE